MQRKLKLGLAVLAAIAGSASVASAVGVYQTSYTLNLTADITGGQPITNIMLLEENDGFGATTWAFGADGEGQTTITNPFLTEAPITRSLLVGLIQDLPGDAPGQKHVVLIMDPTAAALSENIAWGTLFRNTLEDQLIADIELATSGQPFELIQPGLDGLGQFANGDARDGILDPQGVPVSAYFATGGEFVVESWSSGTVLGRGTSAVVAVPEPASVGIVVVAAGVVGLRRRR